MAFPQKTVVVYQAGELCVVGFGDQSSLSHINLAECRRDLQNLIQEHGCKTLAFDLTGVKLIPSGTLGLIASMKKLGVDVHVYNPSDDVRDVLEITRLDTVVHVHQVEIPGREN